MTRSHQVALAVVFAVVLVVAPMAPLIAPSPVGGAQAQSSENGSIYIGLDNGILSAVGANDGSNIWSSDEGTWVNSAAYFSDTDTVFVAMDGGPVKAINGSDGTQKWEFNGHSEANAVSVSSDGNTVYTGGSDDTVRALDASDGTEIWSTGDAFSANVKSVSASPGGGRVYAGVDDNTVRALDASDGSVLWTNSSSSPDNVQASPDGETVYIGSYDGWVRSLDATDGSTISTYTVHSDAIRSIDVSPDSETVYTASYDGTAKAINANDGSEKWSFSGHGDFVSAVSVSPDGETVYTGSADETVKALDSSDGSEMWSSSGPTGTVYTIAAGKSAGGSGTNAITGQVTTQDGQPVPNATVQTLSLNQTDLTERFADPAELEEEAQQLQSELETPFPDRLRNDENLLSDARLGIADDANGASVTPSELDSNYVAVHRPEDWGNDVVAELGFSNFAGYALNFDGGSPTFDIGAGVSLSNPPVFRFDEGPAPAVLSVWDPTDESLIEDGIDADLHGATVQDASIKVTKVDARNSSISSRTLDTEPVASSGPLGKQHYAAGTTLSEGIYWVTPEGGGVGYYVVVGDPVADMSASIENQREQLTERAQWIRDQIENNEISREAVVTNATGHFTLDGSNVHSATMQAYKGPVDDIIQQFGDIDSASDLTNLSQQDLAVFFNESTYNGSFYVPSAPKTAQPGEDVTLRVTESVAPSFPNQMDVQEAWDWLQSYLQDHSYEEALSVIEQRLEDLGDGELAQAYLDMHDMLSENQVLEDRAESLLEENENVTSTLEDLRDRAESGAENLTNTDVADLRHAIQEMQQALEEQQPQIPSEGDGSEIVNETLTASRIFETDLTSDGVMAVVQFANSKRQVSGWSLPL